MSLSHPRSSWTVPSSQGARKLKHVRLDIEQPKAEQFNCAQRAHANYLENFPQTMLYTLVAGLKWPVASAVMGGAWVFFRILFLQGYVYSGLEQGKGRFRGGLFWFFQGGLWAMAAFGVGKSLTDS